jgi:hypothetical protein
MLRKASFSVEVPIAVPPIRVWKALVEPADMKSWFCEFADVDRRPQGSLRFGGRFTFRLDGPEDRGQRLLGFEVGRSLSFAWDVGGLPTVVRYALIPVRGDCRLRVQHDCPWDPNLDWRNEISDHYPWENYLLNLKMYLERGNAGIRVDYEAPRGEQQVISTEVRCASERIWRVLTDKEECSRRTGQPLEFELAQNEGWIEPLGAVVVTDALPSRLLRQRWENERGVVHVRWEFSPRGVTSGVTLTTWGDGEAADWHRGRAGLWTHLLWCRTLNQLKYFAETGSPAGLRRLSGAI